MRPLHASLQIDAAMPSLSRRKLMLAGCSLLTSSAFPSGMLFANEQERFVNSTRGTIKVWDGAKQVVIAYQCGPEKGEPCRRLALAEHQLPVKLAWQLPPEWVKSFPTVHFLKSNNAWEVIEGYENEESFLEDYDDFNRPQRSSRQASPYKEFVQNYYPAYWRWPGRITEHLLDPNGRHRFSEFELRGLKTSEKKRLHAAHHMGLIEPGRRPPSREEIAAGLEAVEGFELPG